MNTDKTLNEKFIEKKGYPIWFYKELKSVNVDYVIAYLLKYPFVVEIDGSKHEITFGHNKKENYVGQCIRYDDIKNSNLCSFEVVGKGFKEGKWFVITDTDTSDDFKAEYIKRKLEYEKEETKVWYMKILKNAIAEHKELSKGQSDKYLQELENSSYEELEDLVSKLIKNVDNKSI